MRRLTLVTVTISTLTWAQTPGMRPLPDASNYPVHDHLPGATMAAGAVSSARLKAVFGSNIYKGYIVIEVAVFPDPNEHLALSQRDFVLKIGETGELLRPSAPSTIAFAIDEKNHPSRTVDMRPQVDMTVRGTIGYDSAGTYNPSSGKRQGTVYAGSEVDVATGARRPTQARANSGPRVGDMVTELEARALPETTVSQPVAGYLYFIPPKKKPNGNYNLDYSIDAGRLKLSVPPPAH